MSRQAPAEQSAAANVPEMSNARTAVCETAGRLEPDLTAYNVDRIAERILGRFPKFGYGSRSDLREVLSDWELPHFDAALTLLIAEGVLQFDSEFDLYFEAPPRPPRPAVRRPRWEPQPDWKTSPYGCDIVLVSGERRMRCMFRDCRQPAALCYRPDELILEFPGCVGHAAETAWLADTAAGSSPGIPLITEVLLTPEVDNT